MSNVLVNAQSTNAYQELICLGARKVNLTVSGGQVLIGFGKGSPPFYPDPDEPYAGVVGSLVRDCDAIRFKSALPGTSATVSIVALS